VIQLISPAVQATEEHRPLVHPRTFGSRPRLRPHDLVEVILMKSAAHTVTTRSPDASVRSEFTQRRGRFSTGMERRPDGPRSRRVGRFCDGMAQLPETPAARRVGRFSTGMEQLPDSPATTRRGSFADGLMRRASARHEPRS
jgi:hypothetical protein